MSTAEHPGCVIVITGAMAAGKSTVAQLLAERLERSVHVRGDVFRRMIVGGRADMTPHPSAEALRQLHLRYELAAATANAYAAAGFTTILQDVVLGAELPMLLDRLRAVHRHLVVLAPTAAALETRESSRGKNGYRDFSAVELDEALRSTTPGLGYWLDSTHQTPAETVAEILEHLEDATV